MTVFLLMTVSAEKNIHKVSINKNFPVQPEKIQQRTYLKINFEIINIYQHIV